MRKLTEIYIEQELRSANRIAAEMLGIFADKTDRSLYNERLKHVQARDERDLFKCLKTLGRENNG